MRLLYDDSRNVIWLNGRKAVISNFESGKPDSIEMLLMLFVTLLASLILYQSVLDNPCSLNVET